MYLSGFPFVVQCLIVNEMTTHEALTFLEGRDPGPSLVSMLVWALIANAQYIKEYFRIMSILSSL